MYWQQPSVRVRVAHSAPLLSAGLQAMLAERADVELIRLDSADALFARPDVVIVDYDNGLALSGERREAHRAAATTRILVITGRQREHEVLAALTAGVEGYLGLDCGADDVALAVHHLARGSRHLCHTAAQHLAASLGRPPLTAREATVLRLTSTGQSNKAVARELGISLGTVKAHLKSVFGKLNVESRTEAANVARQRGLIPQEPPRREQLLELSVPPAAPGRRPHAFVPAEMPGQVALVHETTSERDL